MSKAIEEIAAIAVDCGLQVHKDLGPGLLESVERLMPVHGKQVLTYLRFLNLPVGLLMNISSETFRKGLKRIVNNHRQTQSSRLDIHQ